jgi:zinc and cadmium transporter
MYQVLIVYCVLILLASTAGGSLPSLVKLTHRKIQLTISLVSGVMLGVAFLHLLPHSIQKLGRAEPALVACLIGLLFMFFMVRLFHFHQHDLAVDTEHNHKQKELCDDEADHHHVHCEQHHGGFDFSWAGLCFGLAIHTLIDGVALAAATLSDHSMWVGFGTFLAIVLHKPLDAMSITSLMHARGWKVNQQIVVSLIFSLVCPLGAVLFAFGISQFETSGMLLGYALAFSAGIFLCISLGDLLPEVHFHSHDRMQLSTMLLVGVIIAFAIEWLPGHNHNIPATNLQAAIAASIVIADSRIDQQEVKFVLATAKDSFDDFDNAEFSRLVSGTGLPDINEIADRMKDVLTPQEKTNLVAWLFEIAKADKDVSPQEREHFKVLRDSFQIRLPATQAN